MSEEEYVRVPAKKPRGFAAISKERQREIASLGGKSVPAEKRAFAKDPDLASRVGRIGGLGKRTKEFLE